MLDFEAAAYETAPEGQSAAHLLLSLYGSLQRIQEGNQRVDLARIYHPNQLPTTTVKILDLPVEVIAHLNSVLEVCLFGVEGDELAAQIKENFDLFTKEERLEKLKKSQTELFGGVI